MKYTNQNTNPNTIRKTLIAAAMGALLSVQLSAGLDSLGSLAGVAGVADANSPDALVTVKTPFGEMQEQRKYLIENFGDKSRLQVKIKKDFTRNIQICEENTYVNSKTYTKQEVQAELDECIHAAQSEYYYYTYKKQKDMFTRDVEYWLEAAKRSDRLHKDNPKVYTKTHQVNQAELWYYFEKLKKGFRNFAAVITPNTPKWAIPGIEQQKKDVESYIKVVADYLEKEYLFKSKVMMNKPGI